MTRISNAPVRIPPRATTASTAPASAPAAAKTAKPQQRASAKQQPAFDAAYWSGLEKLAGRPATKATDVDFLRESDAAWNARIDLIRQSQTAVWGSLYILDADKRGLQLVDELIAARRRGVEVCIAVDSIATVACTATDGADRTKLMNLLKTLEAEGGVVTWAGTLDDQLRNPGAGVHFKALVSDNRAAIVGGRNIGEEYYSTWSDFDTRLEGPVVQQVGREALELLRTCDATPLPWQRDAARDARARQTMDRLEALLSRPAPSTGTSPTEPPVDLQLITFDPIVDGKGGAENTITQALVQTIQRAKSEVVLTSNSVSPAPELHDALLAAARRGVKVKLITTGPEDINPLLHEAAALSCADLLAAGCELWETSAHEHGKMYVVDGKVGAYGSYNTSNHSDKRNAEGLLFTADPRVVQKLRSCVEETLSRCELHRVPTNSLGAWIYKMAAKIFG